MQFAFVIFIAALLVVGVALVAGFRYIMPWEVGQSSMVFGWMFISDACYFAYALWRGRWNLARVPLWSFLAYDLVLIGPFLIRLIGQTPSFKWPWPNLIIYTLILLFSGAVALYYLLINPATRPNFILDKGQQ